MGHETCFSFEKVANADGVWVRLDKESMQRYCHETGGEAWSLARGNDDILYLQHEADLLEEAQEHQSPFNFGENMSQSTSSGKVQMYMIVFR